MHSQSELLPSFAGATAKLAGSCPGVSGIAKTSALMASSCTARNHLHQHGGIGSHYELRKSVMRRLARVRHTYCRGNGTRCGSAVTCCLRCCASCATATESSAPLGPPTPVRCLFCGGSACPFWSWFDGGAAATALPCGVRTPGIASIPWCTTVTKCCRAPSPYLRGELPWG